MPSLFSVHCSVIVFLMCIPSHRLFPLLLSALSFAACLVVFIWTSVPLPSCSRHPPSLLTGQRLHTWSSPWTLYPGPQPFGRCRLWGCCWVCQCFLTTEPVEPSTDYGIPEWTLRPHQWYTTLQVHLPRVIGSLSSPSPVPWPEGGVKHEVDAQSLSSPLLQLLHWRACGH